MNRNDIALNGAFAIDDQGAYRHAWKSVYAEDVSSVALAKEEGVPLAVANRVFGKDALKPIIARPPKLGERRREELNEVLVA